MKRLELKVTKRTDKGISFCIKRQSHREGKFSDGSNGFGSHDAFEASNGVLLFSYWHPEIYNDGWELTIFVRGSEKKKDRLVLKTSIENFKKIEQAIAEYNEHFKGE